MADGCAATTKVELDSSSIGKAKFIVPAVQRRIERSSEHSTRSEQLQRIMDGIDKAIWD